MPVSKLQRAVAAARDLACPARSEGERIAYDLSSASFFARDPDARFVLLMMACEALLEPKPRNELVRRCVDDLISLTQTAGLPANDTQSIIGSLRWLYTESIGQAGRRLASGLIPREYMGKHPVHFFTECYALRSALVHGHAERPKAGEVGSHAASLEVFLQDLLSGPLLNLDVAEVEP